MKETGEDTVFFNDWESSGAELKFGFEVKQRISEKTYIQENKTKRGSLSWGVARFQQMSRGFPTVSMPSRNDPELAIPGPGQPWTVCIT